MTDIEQRLREAYGAQHLPVPVRTRTLAAIEEARVRQEGADRASSSGPCGGLRTRGSMAESAGGSPSSIQSEALLSAGAREPAPAAAPLRFRRRPRARFVAALAACLLFVLAAFGLYGVYQTPSAYVDIDVNPAIELTVNPFGIVIGADALNEDGRSVLEAVSVVHRPYRAAIDALAQSEALTRYVSDDSLIDINVVTESGRQANTLMEESDAALAAMPGAHACHRADAATREEASAAGLCVGRYKAARELMELDPSYTLEDCAGMSMRQLRDHIDACHGENNDQNEESPGQSQNDGHGKGHGNGHGRHRG